MATGRLYRCPQCSKEEQAGPLFHALRRLVRGEMRHCSGCKTATQLLFVFNFALGAQGKKASAIAGFLPRLPLLKWPNDKAELVTFYPFLVITDNEQFGRAAWLPYFHVVGDETKKHIVKYGQWAPFLNMPHFADLVTQAQDGGYLKAT